jgi:hypothetical protein
MICLERLIRLWVACYAATRVEGCAPDGCAAAALLRALAGLLHGTGIAMALWHSQLIPLPLALELPLLGSITCMSVRWRLPALIGIFKGRQCAAVAAAEQWLARACHASCTAVVALHQGARSVCEPAGPEPRAQLAVALILWLTLLVPLYLR